MRALPVDESPQPRRDREHLQLCYRVGLDSAGLALRDFNVALAAVRAAP